MTTERHAMDLSRADQAAVVRMLTDTYTQPLEAAVRESVSNAVDAVRRAGKEPDGGTVRVSLEEREGAVWLSVEDWGDGMDEGALTCRFLSYANSDKRGDAGQIGSFGLGAKAPLAYSRAMEVETRAEGHGALLCRCSFDEGGASYTGPFEGSLAHVGTRVSFPLEDGDGRRAKKVVGACRDVMELTGQGTLSAPFLPERPRGPWPELCSFEHKGARWRVLSAITDTARTGAFSLGRLLLGEPDPLPGVGGTMVCCSPWLYPMEGIWDAEMPADAVVLLCDDASALSFTPSRDALIADGGARGAARAAAKALRALAEDKGAAELANRAGRPLPGRGASIWRSLSIGSALSLEEGDWQLLDLPGGRCFRELEATSPSVCLRARVADDGRARQAGGAMATVGRLGDADASAMAGAGLRNWERRYLSACMPLKKVSPDGPFPDAVTPADDVHGQSFLPHSDSWKRDRQASACVHGAAAWPALLSLSRLPEGDSWAGTMAVELDGAKAAPERAALLALAAAEFPRPGSNVAIVLVQGKATERDRELLSLSAKRGVVWRTLGDARRALAASKAAKSAKSAKTGSGGADALARGLAKVQAEALELAGGPTDTSGRWRKLTASARPSPGWVLCPAKGDRRERLARVQALAQVGALEPSGAKVAVAVPASRWTQRLAKAAEAMGAAVCDLASDDRMLVVAGYRMLLWKGPVPEEARRSWALKERAERDLEDRRALYDALKIFFPHHSKEPADLDLSPVLGALGLAPDAARTPGDGRWSIIVQSSDDYPHCWDIALPGSPEEGAGPVALAAQVWDLAQTSMGFTFEHSVLCQETIGRRAALGRALGVDRALAAVAAGVPLRDVAAVMRL